MKKVKSIISNAFSKYCKAMYEIYRPCYEAGINPFI